MVCESVYRQVNVHAYRAKNLEEIAPKNWYLWIIYLSMGKNNKQLNLVMKTLLTIFVLIKDAS